MSKAKNSLRLKVIKTIEEHSLLNGVKRLGLAFSGGVDSAVLFDVLLSLRKRYGFSLFALHINHMIRGEESDRDEDFVKLKCGICGVKAFIERVNVPCLAESGMLSLETAARNARYFAFEALQKLHSLDAVATAHNADDNAETLIFNLTRGGYLDGVCGIPYKRGDIIRPLLKASREEIASYAKEYGVTYVTDSTNAATKYSRNKIRRYVIPALKEINPSFLDTVERETSFFKELRDSLAQNNDLTGKAVCAGENAPENISKLIWQIKKACPGYIDYNTSRKIALAALKNTSKSVVFTLAGGVTANVRNGVVRFETQKGEEGEKSVKNKAGAIEEKFLEKGENSFAGGRVLVCFDPSKNFKHFNKFSTTITLRSVNISGTVYARARKAGDKIKIGGITKSLKKEFINKKIPAEIRDLIPVICRSEDIVCVPFIGVADKFAAGSPEQTKRAKRQSVFAFYFKFKFDVEKSEKDG